MDILYKDEHIVVCVKPAGLLSAKDASGKPNMTDALCKELGCSTVYTVHRLDREVSGVMVYALTHTSAAKLSACAADHTRFCKEYVAVVEGRPEKAEGLLEDLLFKDSSKNKTFVVKKERRGVKKAKLYYKTLAELGGNTLIRVKLFTGRTHQIRAQFASRKTPILGDRKYGGRANERGIELYSFRISFIHPITGEKLDYKYIPEDFKEILL